ncbi:protein NRT1/ PTR FAMILY 5.2-like isoform X2 [Cucurbita moschata]|uniref:Protein NRT1/ PTR FAMILY 5.2-like isoform X2 n=1 Tax=Cucurbita moschata TaxID=3662 RepID=A0A6J1HI43_CUCMO|nr:protein NRT1/ PTR FAMILY 5.2-like isoform X2 [Cucurbita moschata]
MAVEQGLADDYTQDGTVDLKGNPVRRSKRGGWKACSFIIVYEVFERMAFYGISSNLVIYLTVRLQQGIVTASNNVTNWVGVVWMTPVLGAYIADAYLGRFWTFMAASVVYLMGMSFLTMAVSIPSLKPPLCPQPTVGHCDKPSALQLGFYFGALYILAVGTGGTKPNISTIGADQFDDFHPKEKHQKISFFNWWMFGIFFGGFFANIILVYIQENIGWTLGYALPTAGLAISIAIFIAGTPFYRHKVPAGSPFTRMVKVFIAAIKKRKLPLPKEAKELYELDLEEYRKKKKFRMEATPTLSFLNKASIQTGSTDSWRLCTVTEVEETKQMIRMIPILIATIIPSIMLAQSNTLFIKQGTTLDRKIGKFSIPPASLNAFITISLLISIVIYDRIFVKMMRKFTKNPRGITLLQRMGTGIVVHAVIMFVSALVERRRLAAAREHGVVESGGQVPLSIFILMPQFILMGIADAFVEVTKIEFFYDQAPESMKSIGASYSSTSIGIGNFLSSVLLKTVSNITSRNGRKGWILNNLNESHLDYYYGLFTILNCLNFIFFLVVSKYYVYKAELSDSIKLLTQELEEKTPSNESNNSH